ncbi:hypothetical protein [Candidatus Spyradosoma sp. SGI.093]|uniref:hypothetical protein n=1 Tax=Candidatus Spyradosoma sp. SGI.093 TaxID=3420583 RepID=UPI003CFF5791
MPSGLSAKFARASVPAAESVALSAAASPSGCVCAERSIVTFAPESVTIAEPVPTASMIAPETVRSPVAEISPRPF